MKTVKIQLLLVPFLFSLLFSCKQGDDAEKLLSGAQQLMEENPTQALKILDSIPHPEKMPEHLYMEYVVAHSLAKDRNNLDITGDTLVFDACKYFEKKEDVPRMAQAYFQAGAVYFVNKIYGESVVAYKRANMYAQQVNDDSFINKDLLIAKSLNNIAYVYYVCDMPDSTVVYYERGLKHLGKMDNVEEYKLAPFRLMGVSYSSLGDYDAARDNYEKGLEIAQALNDTYYEPNFLHLLGINDRVRKNYGQASDRFHKALSISEVTGDSLRIYMSLIIFHNELNQLDSSRYYVDRLRPRLPEIKDRYVLRGMYKTFSNYYRQVNNQSDAVYYDELAKKADQEIRDERKGLKLMEAENKLTLQTAEQQHDTKHFWEYVLIIILIAVAAILVILTLVADHREHIRMREDLNEAEEKYRQFKERMNNLRLLNSSYSQMVAGLIMAEQKINAMQHIKGMDQSLIDISRQELAESTEIIEKEYLYAWASYYVQQFSFYDKLLSGGLGEDDIILIALLDCEYTDAEVIERMKKSGKELESHKLNLEEKLTKAALPEEQINTLFPQKNTGRKKYVSSVDLS